EPAPGGVATLGAAELDGRSLRHASTLRAVADANRHRIRATLRHKAGGQSAAKPALAGGNPAPADAAKRPQRAGDGNCTEHHRDRALGGAEFLPSARSGSFARYASFSRTIWLTCEPSARPAICGITSAMTRPRSAMLVAPTSAM